MQHVKAFSLIGCLAILCIFLVPKAKGDPFDQKTIVTFSRPVEIPGTVLPAGTYVFRLLDSVMYENVVQVLSGDEHKVLDTFLAIPDYRLKPMAKTVISFEERAAGVPKAIKEWFYPGNSYGEKFVYPKPSALS